MTNFYWRETNFCLLALTEYLDIVVSTLNACFKHCKIDFPKED